MSGAMMFENGLTPEQRDAIDDLRIEIGRLKERIEALPPHRSLSLAVTKLDEAQHWLRDRHHRAAGGAR
jgi:hypothetical protein